MFPKYLLLKGNKSGNLAMGLYSKHMDFVTRNGD